MPLSLQEHFGYNVWANQQLIDCLDQRNSCTPRIGLIVSHIAAATANWADRLNSCPPVLELWEMMPFHVAVDLLLEKQEAIHKVIASRSNIVEITYTNSAGTEFRNTIEQIVLHLVNHNSYHRGQIAEELIRLGTDPPVLDLIAYYRI